VKHAAEGAEERCLMGVWLAAVSVVGSFGPCGYGIVLGLESDVVREGAMEITLNQLGVVLAHIPSIGLVQIFLIAPWMLLQQRESASVPKPCCPTPLRGDAFTHKPFHLCRLGRKASRFICCQPVFSHHGLPLRLAALQAFRITFIPSVVLPERYMLRRLSKPIPITCFGGSHDSW